MIKKIGSFFISFLPWFLTCFLLHKSKYNSYSLPVFALPYPFLLSFGVLALFGLSISVIKIKERYSLKEIKSYQKALFNHFALFHLFIFFFFGIEQLFLAFIVSLLVLITSLFLYYETKELDTRISKFLLIHLYFCLYISLLNLVIYFLNL